MFTYFAIELLNDVADECEEKLFSYALSQNSAIYKEASEIITEFIQELVEQSEK